MTKDALAFRNDGTFTIAQFSDVHWQRGGKYDLQTRDLMKAVIDMEKPDLVVFVGDVIYSKETPDSRLSLHQAVSVAEQSRTPWAIVLGNHDTESTTARRDLLDMALGMEYCMAAHGPDTISGNGNYTIKLTNNAGEIAAVLYFLDSGEYSKLPGLEGYDWIRRDQIEWYAHNSAAFTRSNGGIPAPSVAFFHIPLPEFDEVWNKKTCYGIKHEPVAGPPINTGLFAAMVERGDIMGVFVGHNHCNDYWGTLHGIRLCYGRNTGFSGYGRDDFMRGARIIRLQAGQRKFDTWLRLADQTVIHEQTEHTPS